MPSAISADIGVQLEASVYRPIGKDLSPVVIFHHGSTGPMIRLPTETERPDEWGTYLSSRGIGLVAPMRRGRGRSGGKYLETYYGDLSASRHGLYYALESAYAAEDYVRQLPWVDPTRILLAGASRGGMLALWQAASRRHSHAGVLAFAPGWTSVRSGREGVVDVNLQLFGDIADQVVAPTLLMYAEQDSYYPRSASQKYADQLIRGERSVEVEWLDTPTGHRFFKESVELWIGRADKFIDLCFAHPAATS